MANILDRIKAQTDVDSDILSYQDIITAMREVERGNFTVNQVQTALGLNDDEKAGLTTVYNKIQATDYTYEYVLDQLFLLHRGYIDNATCKTRLGV